MAKQGTGTSPGNYSAAPGDKEAAAQPDQTGNTSAASGAPVRSVSEKDDATVLPPRLEEKRRRILLSLIVGYMMLNFCKLVHIFCNQAF